MALKVCFQQIKKKKWKSLTFLMVEDVDVWYSLRQNSKERLWSTEIRQMQNLFKFFK